MPTEFLINAAFQKTNYQIEAETGGVTIFQYEFIPQYRAADRVYPDIFENMVFSGYTKRL